MVLRRSLGMLLRRVDREEVLLETVLSGEMPILELFRQQPAQHDTCFVHQLLFGLVLALKSPIDYIF
jgi:hypothetical protein